MPVTPHVESALRVHRCYMIISTSAFLAITIMTVAVAFAELADEEKIEAQDLFYDPELWRFNRFLLLGLGLVALLCLFGGLVGSMTYSFCLLLFFGTSGSVLFLLMMAVLLCEGLLFVWLGVIFAVVSVSTACVSLHMAYKINQFRGADYRPAAKREPMNDKVLEEIILT